MNNSLDILSEGLDKKIEVLKAIKEYNQRQKEAFSSDNIDMDSFDEAIEEKDQLIERLLKLDEGFDSLYNRLAEELKANKGLYADKIKLLQEKIRVVTELSVSIEAEEARNKQLVEAYFSKARAGLGQDRKVSRAAYGYYQSSSGANSGQTSIFDLKK